MTDIILFDLGNVVIELGSGPLPAEWLNETHPFTLREWFKSETALAFERGDISALELARHLQKDLKLRVSPETIVEEFRKWPIRIYPELPSLLLELRKHYRLAVLSNTNELHYPRLFDEFDLGKYFDPDLIFASHLIGKAKPDAAAFIHVLDKLNAKPEQVLFLDDMEENVQSATVLGIQAKHVKGSAQVMPLLRELLLRKQLAEPGTCPLCGDDNRCASMRPDNESCWCTADGLKFPESLLDRLPDEIKNKACICKNCVLAAIEDGRHDEE